MATPKLHPPKPETMTQWQLSTFFPSATTALTPQSSPPPSASSLQFTPYPGLFNGINTFDTTQTIFSQTPSSAPTEGIFGNLNTHSNEAGGLFGLSRPGFVLRDGAEYGFHVPPSPPVSDSQSPQGFQPSRAKERDLPMGGVAIVRKMKIDDSLTLKEFHFFDQLPRDIVASVVDQCTPADGVALSLTCKTIYTLAGPLLLQRSSSAYALTFTHRLRPCCNPPVTDRYGSVRESHCVETQCPTCPARFYRMSHISHCTVCSDCPLWTRLDGGLERSVPKNRRGKSWIQTVTKKDKRWCVRCSRFTLRTAKNKGVCRHGAKKRPECAIRWSFQKQRGGFGPKLWKQLYTEAGLRSFVDRHDKDRAENPHYGLRKRPRPTQKRLQHKELRRVREQEEPLRY